jgi:hypothetical protein
VRWDVEGVSALESVRNSLADSEVCLGALAPLQLVLVEVGRQFNPTVDDLMGQRQRLVRLHGQSPDLVAVSW